jgi:hypothetical protein
MLNITKDFIYGRLMMIKKKMMESKEKVEEVFSEHEQLKMLSQVAITIGVYYFIMEFVVMKIISRVPIQIGFF